MGRHASVLVWGLGILVVASLGYAMALVVQKQPWQSWLQEAHSEQFAERPAPQRRAQVRLEHADPGQQDRRAQLEPVQHWQLAQQQGAQETAAPTGVPDGYGLVILIRSTLIALNHANLTGNYSVLRDMAAPGFQQANNPASLAAIFADLRQREIDMGPLAVIDPQLMREPHINDHGMLRLTGFFPTRPEQVNFDLAFQPVNGAWRLFAIGVNTSTMPAGSNSENGRSPPLPRRRGPRRARRRTAGPARTPRR